MTFDSKIARSSQHLLKRFVFLGSLDEYLMIGFFLRVVIGVLSCPFWCIAHSCGARLPIHTFNYRTVLSVVPVVPVFEDAVWWLDFRIAHTRSVAVLCMLYKIRCNPIHPLYCALPVPFVHRTLSYLCASSMHNFAVPEDFHSFSVCLWSDLGDPVFAGIGLAGFKSNGNTFLSTYATHFIFVF